MYSNIIICILTFTLLCLTVLLFLPSVSKFSNGEILLITQEIEKIKAADLARYNTLINEWKGLVSNSKAKVELASADLRLIIAAIKNI